MVTIKNYIPVLRWKKAERDALATLDVKIRENITPLFELIMPAPKLDKGDYTKILSDSKAVLQNNLPSTTGELNKCCPIDSSAFVDVHLIDGDLRADTLKQILDGSPLSQATLIPVTHIIPVVSTDADMSTRKVAVDYATSSDNGLCIRIDRYNLNDKDLGKVISDFVVQNRLDISKTDLLIDLGIVNESDDAKNVSAQLAKLPALNDWRTVILSGGAFPRDLSDLEAFSDHDISRLEWQLWNSVREALKSTATDLAFSDYTIQHPVYYGQIPGAIPSASIRYALEDNWKIMRGTALNNPKSVGFDQYPEQAKLLVNASGIFKGKDYSRGDDYMLEKSQDNPNGTGNPMTWLRAGINHHLTLVIKQLSTSDETATTHEQ